jgi:CubicO group peptidase (beta-lactamase class C family)
MMMINRGRYGDTRILSPGSVEAMSHDQRIGSFNPVPYDESRFGLGWDTVAQPALSAVGVKAWQKTGDFSGLYGANMVVAPDEKLGVVVFGSSGSHSTSFASSHAVKISNRILLRALVERGRIPGMPASLSTASLPLKAVTAEEKNTFTGF